jgi:hypothetical protein
MAGAGFLHPQRGKTHQDHTTGNTILILILFHLNSGQELPLFKLASENLKFANPEFQFANFIHLKMH